MARKPSSTVRADIWMPMYWGDYLRDTGHLNAQEHGAYLMLIAHYWCTGKVLPDDDVQLARIARVTRATWKKIKPTMAAFFEVAPHVHWGHSRIEREMLAAADRKEAAVNRAKAGAAARWGDAPSMLRASVKHASHNHIHKSSESPSSEISTDAARGSALGGGSEPRAQRQNVHERVAALAAARRMGNA